MVTNKIVPLLTCLLLASTVAHAQWVTQPIGFQNRLATPYFIKAVNPTTVWTIGVAFNTPDTNQVARSTDGGVSWTTGIVTGVQVTNESVTCLTAVDSVTAWVGVEGGSNSRIMKTTDGGQTWVRQTTPQQFGSPESYPTVVHFFNANEGVCVGDPVTVGGPLEVYRTTDGGATWTAVTNTPPSLSTENGAENVYAVAGDIIWVGTLRGRVFRSVDKGATWTVAATGLTERMQTLAFRDAQNGLASSLDTRLDARVLERTTDGGLTWSRVAFTGFFPGFGLDNVPGTGNYVSTGPDVGDGLTGSAFSRDNGQTWITLENTGNNLYVDFVSPTAGWTGIYNATTAAGEGMRRFTSTVLGTRATTPEQLGFSVYPNPSTDGHFTISPQAARKGVELRVTDAVGREVMRRAWQGNAAAPFTLDLSSFQAGIYTLQIQSDTGVGQQQLVLR